MKDGTRIARLDANGVATYDDWLNGAPPPGPAAIDPASIVSLDYNLGHQWLAITHSSDSALSSVSAAAILWPWSIWPTPSVEDTRASIGTIPVTVFKVIQAPVTIESMTNRVRSGINFWQKQARILLEWDGNVIPEDACPEDQAGCPTSSLRNILTLSEDHDCTQELYARFRTQLGVHFVFMQDVRYRGDVAAYTLSGTDAQGNLVFFNVVAVPAESPDVLAHELGHVFQLQHVVPFAALNLMCGPAFPGDPTPCAPWWSRILLPPQIYEARKNAVKLVEAR